MAENEVQEVQTEVANVEAPKDTPKETLKEESNEVKELKRKLSEYASEVSKYKKAYKEKLSTEEKAEADRKEKWEAMEMELNSLKREKEIGAQENAYISMGFESELARETAEALVNGDFATVNANLKKHFEGVKKQAVADAMLGTPSPVIGSGSSQSVTVESIMSIADTGERRKAMAEHPELFGIE